MAVSMRRFKVIPLLVLSLSCLVLAQVSYASASNPSLPSNIVIGGHSQLEAPPYTWIDSCTGEPTGSSKHINDRVLGNLGIRSSFAPPVANAFNLKPILDDLLAGKFDLLVGIPAAVQFDDVAVSKQPHVVIKGGVAYRRGQVSVFLGYRSLMNSKVAISKTGFATLTDQARAALQDNRITPLLVENVPEGMNRLANKEIDFLIVSQYQKKINARDLAEPNSIDYSLIDDFDNRFFVAVRNQQPWLTFLDQYDKGIAALSPEYIQRVEESYLSNWFSRKRCDG